MAKNSIRDEIGRRQLILLATILITAVTAVTAMTSLILYNAAFDEQAARLTETVKSRARMIEAIARFDMSFSANAPNSNTFETTMAQIREAHQQFIGGAKSGEFVIAHRKGNTIEFLLRQHHSTSIPPPPVSLDEANAEPMRRALNGESGVIVAPDYRGDIVLAAYEPLSVFGLGVVAKIDLAEIRAPFIKAVLWSFAGAVVLIVLGALAFNRIINPMIRSLEVSKQRLSEAQAIGRMGNIEWNIAENRYNCSDEVYRIFGIEPGMIEPTYDNFLIMIHAGDREIVQEAALNTTLSDKPFELDYRVVLPDGKTKWIHEVSHVIRDKQGNAITRRSTLQDITKRKLNEIKLNKSNRQLKRAMSTIKTISGVVPLCAWCGRQIRRSDGEWVRLEEYFEEKTDAQISHGICPRCQAKMNGEISELDTLDGRD